MVRLAHPETGLSHSVKCFYGPFQGSASLVDHLCCFLFVLCFCARLFIYALWSPASKGLTYWLSFVMCNCEVKLSIFHWYPGSGMALDCIDS